MSSNSEENSIYIAQLTQLNNRVNVYAAKMWHLPFAYVAIICVSIASFKNVESKFVYIIVAVLFSAGIACLTIIRNHKNRISQLIGFVHALEVKLNLEESMEEQKVIPYYATVVVCMLALLIAVLAKTIVLYNKAMNSDIHKLASFSLASPQKSRQFMYARY